MSKKRRPSGAGSALDRLKKQNNALLDTLAAILLAYGNGPDSRLAVSNSYVGVKRRPVVVDPMLDGKIVVRFAPADPVTEESK